MGLENYQTPNTPEEAISDFQRLMDSLMNVPDVTTAVREQALAVLHPAEDNRTPNQTRLEVAQFGAYVTATADQIVNAPRLAERSALSEASFPRTIMKLAQELLTDPAFMQIFSAKEVADGDLRALLQECILDSRLITDHLLEVFGLDEFKPSEVDSRGWIYKHDQIAIRARAIDAIKDFLADGFEPLEAVSVSGRRLRVFRVTKGKNRGKVVITRKNGDDRKTLELMDLHSIGRRVGHIHENYTEKDIATLGRIKRMIDNVTREVTSGWDKWRPRVEELEREVAEACKGLSPSVRDTNKKIILGKVTRCLTMKDKTDRVNPYSRLAILNSAKRFIDTRLGNVRGISGYIAEDDLLALSHLQDDTAQIKEWYEAMSSKYGNSTQKAGVDKPLTAEEVPIAIRSLQQHKDTLGRFKFQPYLGIAEKAIAELDKILAVIDTGDLSGGFPSMQVAFAKFFAYAKLIEVDRRVVDLRNRYFHPSQDLHALHPNIVRNGVSEIIKVLRSRQVAPSVQVDELTPVYSAVFDAITEMNDLAKDACRSSVDQCVSLLKQIDALMRAFDIGAILEETE